MTAPSSAARERLTDDQLQETKTKRALRVYSKRLLDAQRLAVQA